MFLYSHKYHSTMSLNFWIRNNGHSTHTDTFMPWKGDLCLYLKSLLVDKCYWAQPSLFMLHLRYLSQLQMLSYYCMLPHPKAVFSIIISQIPIQKMRHCFKCKKLLSEYDKIILKFILEKKSKRRVKKRVWILKYI